MALHDQRRQLARRGLEVGVGGRVVEAVGDRALAGRELDRSRRRDVAPGRSARRSSCAHRLQLARGGVVDDDRRLALGAGGGEGDAVPWAESDGEAERGEGEAEVARALRPGLEQRQAFGAALGQRTQAIGAVVEEGVGGAAEEPLGVGEVGLLAGQLHRLAVLDAVEVPPAVAVGDEVQPPGRVPLGLEDRLGRAAGDAPGLAGVRERRQPELGPVPGHVRVVPAGPGDRGCRRG